nr:MAG TPA: hypothetical protein [Caudoviricetes sp.]
MAAMQVSAISILTMTSAMPIPMSSYYIFRNILLFFLVC